MLDKCFGRDLPSKVGNFDVAAFEHDAYEVFADIVAITHDGADDGTACDGLLVLDGEIRLKHLHRKVGRCNGCHHFSCENLAFAIGSACGVHAGEQTPVQHVVCGYAQFYPGESFEHFQSSRMVFIQIESQQGIDRLPELLEGYGEHINGVIIGPNDMSVMLGTPFDCKSAVMEAAARKVFEVSAKYGVSCGIFCNDAADAAHYRDMGANVLWTASDLQFYCRGFGETMDELEKL